MFVIYKNQIDHDEITRYDRERTKVTNGAVALEREDNEELGRLYIEKER